MGQCSLSPPLSLSLESTKVWRQDWWTRPRDPWQPQKFDNSTPFRSWQIQHGWRSSSFSDVFLAEAAAGGGGLSGNADGAEASVVGEIL